MSIPLISYWQYLSHATLIPSLSSGNFADLLSSVMCTNEGKDEAMQCTSTCGQTGNIRSTAGQNQSGLGVKQTEP